MSYWRQGDIYFQSVSRTPDMHEARRRAVLFHGEATGHSHCIRAPRLPLVLEEDGELFIEADAPFEVVHDEHGPIAFEPGSYRVWQQRVFAGQWRVETAGD